MKKFAAVCLAILFFIVIMVIHHVPREDDEETTLPTGTNEETTTDIILNDTDTLEDLSENTSTETQTESETETETTTNSVFESDSETSGETDAEKDTGTIATQETETESDTFSEDESESEAGTSDCNHVDIDENDHCDICGDTIKSQSTNHSVIATFEFGENGDTKHSDGGQMKEASSVYQSGEYKLVFSIYENVYKNARDAKGNSALKLGKSEGGATLEFSVPQDVSQIVIRVAKYKEQGSKVYVNGREFVLSKNSNDGEYDVIIIDTSSVKSIRITTNPEDQNCRCMINSIEYYK